MITELLMVESVGFLVAVKEALENPLELLMDNNPKKALEL
jgi:2-oxoglutarate dehydrogenase E2 component (dihydrolipoamide succinyltransferase)